MGQFSYLDTESKLGQMHPCNIQMSAYAANDYEERLRSHLQSYNPTVCEHRVVCLLDSQMAELFEHGLQQHVTHVPND